MSFEAMRRRILAMPEVVAWPRIVEMIGRAGHQEWRSLWDYPFIACRAVGGPPEAAVPGAAAVFFSLIGIHLVDDMLDEEADGDYRTFGTGNTANLALAFQALAHRALDDVEDRERRAALQSNLARMAWGTAFGQDLDARPLRGEEDYWKVVAAKTPPLFGSAFFLGAMLGGAPEETAAQLERLGGVMGMFIQVSDDLSDALKTPAGADWRRRLNNLPILYASTANHQDREEFARLCDRVDDPAALEAAQKILLRSGAVSYCALKLIEFSRQAGEMLAGIPLSRPGEVWHLLDVQMQPLDRVFRSVGVETPAALLLD